MRDINAYAYTLPVLKTNEQPVIKINFLPRSQDLESVSAFLRSFVLAKNIPAEQSGGMHASGVAGRAYSLIT